MIYWEKEKTMNLLINEFIFKEKDDNIFQANLRELTIFQNIIDGNIILTGNDIDKYLYKGFEI